MCRSWNSSSLASAYAVLARALILRAIDDCDGCLVQLSHRAHEVNAVETLVRQPANSASQRLVLSSDDVGGDLPIGAAGGSLDAEVDWQIEDDGHALDLVLLRTVHYMSTGERIDVGGVDHRQPTLREPFADDEVQDVEGVRSRVLIVLVVGYQPAAYVARQYLIAGEVTVSKARLA
jgi:hypothetical protein